MCRLGKLPFTAALDTPMVADAAVIRLAKNIALPMEDLATFKNIMDRRINLDLRKLYQVAGAACK